eukprot:CAMPEP_0183346054 /NCGR_PEP_ID=MMETSP0164_2-20130417/11284_1 /TAXON_ID=221442 /ORGANISM="Coccolithus pelagicus ssp braarudi, Strain PLY182g" /LENGTH=73 /DNA_ID=CAMNT_0025517269 /DNA_START=236 /DNA_END=457 /DNA_ORIENTATION=-
MRWSRTTGACARLLLVTFKPRARGSNVGAWAVKIFLMSSENSMEHNGTPDAHDAGRARTNLSKLVGRTWVIAG